MPEYFTLVELNALPNMGEGRYTDARKEAAAAYIVGIIERVVDTSFIARTVTDERHDGGCSEIVLRQPHVLSVTSATEDGVAVTDTLRVVDGVLRRFASATDFTPIAWASGVGNVAVTYQAGYSSTVPADVKEAALLATRWRLIASNSNSDMNARQTSMTNDMGGTTSFAVAGVERPTGYPEVDAVIIGWRDRLNVFGFA
jgi:hypothetical protein